MKELSSITDSMHSSYTKHSEAIIGTIATSEMLDVKKSSLCSLELDPRNTVICQRSLLESTRLFRQFITYCPVVNSDGEVLVYLRKKGGNEPGLHDLYSIGFGGHCDAENVVFDESGGIDLHKSIEQTIYKELEEEIKLTKENFKIDHLPGKYLLSNDNEVDAVHLGFVSIVHAVNQLESGEEDVIGLVGFMPIIELATLNLEGWSRTLIESPDFIKACQQISASK